MDIFLLMFNIRSKNNITKPLFARANYIERFAQKGIIENEFAHLFFIFPIRAKISK